MLKNNTKTPLKLKFNNCKIPKIKKSAQLDQHHFSIELPFSKLNKMLLFCHRQKISKIFPSSSRFERKAFEYVRNKNKRTFKTN
jgi:hypothetical protein